MDYKGYCIQQTSRGFDVYSSYESWVRCDEPLHRASSQEETESWIDDEQPGNPRRSPIRTACGVRARPLFEKAALEHLQPGNGDFGEAGAALGTALRELYQCLGLEMDFDAAFRESERWFSFFNLWGAARFLEQGRTTTAIELLEDQEESYSPTRASALGILQDYGQSQTANLHSGTEKALRLARNNMIKEAVSQADEVADIQYWLAVDRAGKPTPGSQEVSNGNVKWIK